MLKGNLCPVFDIWFTFYFVVAFQGLELAQECKKAKYSKNTVSII